MLRRSAPASYSAATVHGQACFELRNRSPWSSSSAKRRLSSTPPVPSAMRFGNESAKPLTGVVAIAATQRVIARTLRGQAAERPNGDAGSDLDARPAAGYAEPEAPVGAPEAETVAIHPNQPPAWTEA